MDTPPEEVQETKVYNPIGAKVGGSITIDDIDYRGLNFFVKEIREYKIQVGGERHQFVDYVLLARPLGKDDLWVRLRLVPDRSGESRFTHRAMVLSLYDDLPYNEGLHDVVRDSTLKFVVDDDMSDDDPDNDIHEEFWRVNDVAASYTAKVSSLKDVDGSGKVDRHEVSRSEIEFWDYSRMTDIDGVEAEEFLFVEMDTNSGWFQIWRGCEVNPERVDAI